jgi:hypothetical protein
MQLPAISSRVIKPLPKSKRKAKDPQPAPKPKMRLPEGAIRKVEWTYGNAPVKRLAYGVVPYKGAKIKLTAHERMHLLYVSPERHIIAYWDRRPADHRMLPNIRKHLGIEAHHLGSPVNRAMAKRLPEHEREALAVCDRCCRAGKWSIRLRLIAPPL